MGMVLKFAPLRPRKYWVNKRSKYWVLHNIKYFFRILDEEFETILEKKFKGCLKYHKTVHINEKIQADVTVNEFLTVCDLPSASISVNFNNSLLPF